MIIGIFSDNALDFFSNEKSLNILDYKIDTDNLLEKADRKRPKNTTVNENHPCLNDKLEREGGYRYRLVPILFFLHSWRPSRKDGKALLF